MQATESYFDGSGRDDVLSGGVKLVPIVTPKGEFRVWTKRIGNNPKVKVLLLHGGPGATHEYLEACDSYFPAAGIEYSDQPADPDLWDIPRFVDDSIRGLARLGSALRVPCFRADPGLPETSHRTVRV